MYKKKHNNRYASKARNGRQAQQRGADNSLSRNQGANTPVVVIATRPSRNTRYLAFYRICSTGMKLFKRVADAKKTPSTKRESLNLAITLSSYYPDAIRFWLDLEDQAKLLLDSKRFERECEAWDLKPENVAQHLVVEGKATVNRVLKLGLVEGYGENAKLFIEPLNTVDIKPEKPAEATSAPTVPAVEVKPEGSDD